MILVDANIWIAHLDAGEPLLAEMLPEREALIHPYTIGEVVLGSIPDRPALIAALSALPRIVVARHQEVMRLIATRNLSGIGYVDCHLLASVLLKPDVRLWTRDRRLRAQAERLGVLAPLA